FNFFRAHAAGIDTFGAEVEAELLQNRGLEAVEIPFVRMGFFAGVTRDQIDDDVVGNTYQVFFLVFTLQQLLAKAVYRFALLIHDVVVFEDVFAVGEVLTFNTLLGVLDYDDVMNKQREAVYGLDRKSTRLNSSHVSISYAVF